MSEYITPSLLQPIRFISLPDESTVNEDFNDYFIVHEIITYDYNNHYHDNVTCEMTVTPEESTKSFELRHDGYYDYNCRYPLQLYVTVHTVAGAAVAQWLAC